MPQPRQQTSTPRRVGVREFRGNLSSFLKQVEEGQRFVLTSRHKVVAEIGPPSSDVVIRKPGALRGKIKVADDFDSLPEDVLKSMEDGT
ncbi:antitoxin of toxin-antitoxin stability system [Sinorhizobium meliloti]|uniref:type II toxin-antitoxin system Phd/YefM family antitoxin n=1 Tax=Rhizobium meliloti TaxID=382 RepID=UPI0002FB3CC9|nr:antitoxin [Sinorhizobium meliloti]MDE3876370.1 antitoxin of toxin-antitoxin stability system [Sinorhizobium meliloti]MQV19633.1 antitoxin of toxin-antitoxin stability system [Sinorhizobium meliloti]